MAVFITGATGFIGRRLVRSFNGADYPVRVAVRPRRIPDQRIPSFCEQLPLELTDVDSLATVVANSRAVIYCAGTIRGRKPADFSTANIAGVQAMIAALERSHEPPPLLLISSLAASRPELSDYAHSKNAGEQLLLAKPLLPWSIMRPPAVYGPGDRDMLPLFKLARHGLLPHAGPHDQRLSLLHVDDLIAAILAWLARPHNCRHKTYAIDDGCPGAYDWPAIADTLCEGRCHVLKLPNLLLQMTAKINMLFSFLLGYQPMITPGKIQELIQQDWLCDNNQEFATATGWQPDIDLHSGVQNLFDGVH